MLLSLYFRAAPSSVAAIRRTIQLHLQRGISDNCLYSLIYISILYKCYMEYIYVCIIPFRQLSPCTALLCIPQTWRNCPGAKLLFTPEQQGREVEHSSGVLRTTPHTYYGCCTLSGLPSESKARSFSQKLNVVHASLRE